MKQTGLLALVVSVVVLSLDPWVRGDIVYMKDGSTREGKITAQTAEAVTLQMHIGGVNAVVQIPRADVLRIEIKKTPTELLRDELAERERSLKAGDLGAMEELARWCRKNELYTEAAGIYEQMTAFGDEGVLRGRLGVLEMEFERGRLNLARQTAEELKQKSPTDPKVLDWVKKLDDMTRQAAVDAVAHAVKQEAADSPAEALKTLQQVLARTSAEDVEKTLQANPLPDKMSLYEYMAKVRLERSCPLGTDGMVTCRTCKGTGDAADKSLCPTCRGLGKVLCAKCDGTGIIWDAVPVPERPAVIVLLGKMAVEEDRRLQQLKNRISDKNVTVEQADKLAVETLGHANRARVFRNRALPLITEADTIKDFVNQRLSASLTVAQILTIAGGRLDAVAQDTLKTIDKAAQSRLGFQHDFLKVQKVLERALVYYTSIEPEGMATDLDIRTVTKRLQDQAAAVRKIVVDNGQIMLVYDAALKAAKEQRYADALRLLEELANHASKLDMAYLSTQFQKAAPTSLSEFMADARFELGKDKANFGEPTEFDKAAFVDKLFREADAKARQADQSYQEMRDARLRGRAGYVPAGKINTTRDMAHDARDWYKTLIKIKYPFRRDIIEQINHDIDNMEHIIRKCSEWYNTPVPVN